ncbi:protein penguin [Teleopsis dalmanni]|uniref:protein penguin n=1 Tax=Teleopsis dalmanni TaxID=139649 RepID=UPI0018CE5AEF|nr:protein penguin [Teleopsis dalmanni]
MIKGANKRPAEKSSANNGRKDNKKLKSPKKFKRDDDQSNKTPKPIKKSGHNENANKKNFKPGGNKTANAKFVNKNTKGKNEQGKTNEKTDWNKFKKDKKELKLKRKQAKDSYQISIEAKQIYEKLKCRRTEDKSKLVEKLYNLVGGNDVIKKLVMAHDTARIIQCMLKFASPALREQLSDKLLPLSVDMSVSKYSHFCVLRMFKYGSPITKSKLVDSFMSNIVKLACHSISSKILDHVYLTVANPKQQAYMRQEFYGELYRKTKDDSVKQLADAYKDTSNMKASILGSVKTNLEHVANKQLVDSSLVHSVMLEYLNECDDDKIEEAVTMFASLIPLMVTTKDGCQAAIITFYKSTAKNRRAIIKTIKEHLTKICSHEHGHIFIIAVLNSLDDTKATKKAIFDTIHPELKTLMSNQWGRSVIEWLVAPADTNCFHPGFINTIDKGLEYGKKDKEIRRKEIFEQIEEPIANDITSQPEFWLSDRHIGLVTAEILKKLTDNYFVEAAKALATVIANPTWTVSVVKDANEKKTKKKVHDIEQFVTEANKIKKQKREKIIKLETENIKDNSDSDGEDEKEEVAEDQEISTQLGVEEPGLHIVLKKILKNDKERLSQNENAETFGNILTNNITKETIKSWSNINRAYFVLLNIMENNTKTSDTLKELLQNDEVLEHSKLIGAQLLLKKLNSD